jgi:hypothetical protein
VARSPFRRSDYLRPGTPRFKVFHNLLAITRRSVQESRK